MQNFRKYRRSGTLWRQGSRALAMALVGSSHASAAQANWGENWGEMTWGSAITSVPVLNVWGVLLLVSVLAAAARVLIAKRRGARASLVVLALLVVPLVAVAASITVPNAFVNGTPADADDVNENFDTLVLESNDQDGRIGTLESGVVHTHPGTDITSQVGDADTVDGAHAAALEESGEIDADIATHAGGGSAHHSRYGDPEALAAMGPAAAPTR
jgi:hypothetical protein